MHDCLGYDCDGNNIYEYRILRAIWSNDVDIEKLEDADPRQYCAIIGNDGKAYAISVYDWWNKELIRKRENITGKEIPVIVKSIDEMENYEVATCDGEEKEFYYSGDRNKLKKELNNILKVRNSQENFTVVINDNNLNDNNINKFGDKVRAILLSDDKILVSNYGGVILLPGGSIDKGETMDDAIIRELEEETGIVYDLNNLNYFLTIKYYQSNYPTRNNEVINRLMNTHYYIGKFNGINLNNIRRTEKEIIDNFSLELINIDDLLLSEVSNNPRRKFFDRENEEIVKVLKKLKSK